MELIKLMDNIILAANSMLPQARNTQTTNRANKQ